MKTTIDYSLNMDNGLLVLSPKQKSPVTISVPHDGLTFKALSGFFKPRKVGYKGRDKHVWPIAKDILISAPINVVRGLMPRTLVDYNRSWPEGVNYYPLTQKEVHTALDDERLSGLYSNYHKAIDKLIHESLLKFGLHKTLLIDLHGFIKQPLYAPSGGYDLIFGTGNRKSIPHGNVDVALAEWMMERGYKVFLPKDLHSGKEEDYYSADFTTRHHSEKHNINVIQIEIASRFRARGAQKIGRQLSLDFAGFINDYCSK